MKFETRLLITVILYVSALICLGFYQENKYKDNYDENINNSIEETTEIHVDIIEETEEVEEFIPEYIDVDDCIYTIERVNLRYEPSTDSKILITAMKNTKLDRIADGTTGWDKVLIDGKVYYVFDEYLSVIEPEEISIDIMQQIKEANDRKEKLKESNVRYLSAIIYAEARGECLAGQQAVGIIVMNRVKSSKFPNTIYDVLHAPGQFSPVCKGGGVKFKEALQKYDNGEMPETCIEAAKYALLGNKTVVYNGQIIDLHDYHFFSRYIKNCRVQIQNHMFK
jgi:hypothetical protein